MSVRRTCAAALLAATTALAPVLLGGTAQAGEARLVLPVVSAVAHAFPLPGTTVGAKKVTVQLQWKAVAGTFGICGFQYEQYRDGSWNGTVPVSTTSTVLQLDAGHAYTFYVWAVDCDDNEGPAVASKDFYPDRAPEGKATPMGTGWTSRTVTAAMDGAIAVSRKRGDSFSYTDCYTNLAWIAQKGPQGGTALVKVDGVALPAVNLYSATVKDRQLVSRTFNVGNGCHTLTVTNTSLSTTRNALTLDGFLVQSE